MRPIDEEKLARALKMIDAEYRRAAAKFAPFHSAHEGFAVLDEERDELWEVVKAKGDYTRNAHLAEEAMQVGAMAARFLIDVCFKSESLPPPGFED